MTTSCRSTMGNISDALTTIIFDDLSRLLRTGMVYSKMAARMDELAEMVSLWQRCVVYLFSTRQEHVADILCFT